MKEGWMEEGAATIVILLPRRCSQHANFHSLACFVLAIFLIPEFSDSSMLLFLTT